MNFNITRGMMAGVLLAIFLAASAHPASAQTPGRGHELRLGLGGYPTGADLSKGFSIGCVYDREARSNIDRFHDYKGDEFSFGTLTLQYSFNFNEKRAIAVNLGYDHIFGYLYDGHTQRQKGGQHSFGFSVYPEYRRTWNPRRSVKVYSALSAGFGIGVYHNTGSDMERYYDSASDTYYKEDPWSIIPVLQFTPVGISCGRRWFGFAEMTLGTLMFGGRAGVGYKF